VREQGDYTVVEALDPAVTVAVTDKPELGPVAAEAKTRLTAMLDALVEVH
jgi:hypothetical protein